MYTWTTSGDGVTAFSGLGPREAREFAERWLPAWSGNRPEELLRFYTADAHYADPSVPAGLTGHEQLRPYFHALLRRHPHWVWTQRHSTPIRDGFLNYWHMSAPVGARTVEADGVCLVQLRDGLIYRNEVFFDRSELVAAVASDEKEDAAGSGAP